MRAVGMSQKRRRVLVAITVVTTALLGSALPVSFHGLAMLVVLWLVALDVVLVRATGGLAFRRSRALDERETALRDLAYRRGFRLLGVALVLEVVVLIASNALGLYARGPSFTTVVDSGVTGRALVALLDGLVMLPTIVIAWIDRDRLEDDLPAASRRDRLTWLALPAVAAAWLALMAAGPEQAAAASRNHSSSFGLQGATCTPFAAGRIVGAEFGATVGMRVGVCWNGHDAFVFGNPTIGLPASAIAAMNIPPGTDIANVDPAQPDITACGADNLDDFATVSSTTCTARIDDGGTLHYWVRARVAGPFGIGQRDVTLTLLVDRNGQVLERP